MAASPVDQRTAEEHRGARLKLIMTCTFLAYQLIGLLVACLWMRWSQRESWPEFVRRELNDHYNSSVPFPSTTATTSWPAPSPVYPDKNDSNDYNGMEGDFERGLNINIPTTTEGTKRTWYGQALPQYNTLSPKKFRSKYKGDLLWALAFYLIWLFWAHIALYALVWLAVYRIWAWQYCRYRLVRRDTSYCICTLRPGSLAVPPPAPPPATTTGTVRKQGPVARAVRAGLSCRDAMPMPKTCRRLMRRAEQERGENVIKAAAGRRGVAGEELEGVVELELGEAGGANNAK